MPLSLKLAFKYVFTLNKSSFSSYASLLAVGGLSIGITALMLTASIVQGFEETISKKLSSYEGTCRIQHVLGRKIHLDEDPIRFLHNKSKESIEPFVRGLSMVRFGSMSEGVIIEGINDLPTGIESLKINRLNNGEIIIGKMLANYLGVEIDDLIFLQSFESDFNPAYTPNVKLFKVKDIFSSGLNEYDKTLVFISLYDAQLFLKYDLDEVTGLIYKGDKSQIGDLNISYPYYTETWKQRHALLFDWISLQRWPAYLMFGLISFVGLINLIAAIAMIIIEKSYQIGILNSQGLSKLKIRSIFIFQGAIISFIGCIMGGVFSFLIITIQLKYSILSIPTEIYFMDQIPFSFNYYLFVIILFVVIITSIFASWYPTKLIHRINPSELLRYE